MRIDIEENGIWVFKNFQNCDLGGANEESKRWERRVLGRFIGVRTRRERMGVRKGGAFLGSFGGRRIM